MARFKHIVLRVHVGTRQVAPDKRFEIEKSHFKTMHPSSLEEVFLRLMKVKTVPPRQLWWTDVKGRKWLMQTKQGALPAVYTTLAHGNVAQDRAWWKSEAGVNPMVEEELARLLP